MKDSSLQMMVAANDIENSSSSSKSCFLPEDMVINILKRLSVKSLTRFKCVAKDWVKLIESSHFIAQHLSHSASNTSLLLDFWPPRFLFGPHLELEVQIPPFMNLFIGKIIASCNGLLCVRSNNNVLFVCNPATRQIKHVPNFLIGIPVSFYIGFGIGFGYSHIVNDYKIVGFSTKHIIGSRYEYDGFDRAVVYSLTTGSCREINMVNLHLRCPAYTISYANPVTANGAIFWEVNLTSDPYDYLILSFDIAQETFTLFKSPPQSQSPHTSPYGDTLTIHEDKLAIFRRLNVISGGFFQSCFIEVWVLEDQDTCAVMENWVKKYRLGPFTRRLVPTCFWRDGIVCSESSNHHRDEENGVLSIINPYSNELKSFVVHTRLPLVIRLLTYAESLIAVGNIDQNP